MRKSCAWLFVMVLSVAGCSQREGEVALSPVPSADSDVSVETADGTRPSEAPKSSTPVTLAVVGDIMLARGVGDRMQRQGTDAVLTGVRDELVDADLTIGNLEAPIGEGGDPANKAYTFLATDDAIDVLKDGSFDVLSLANNHILDRGVIGLKSTQEMLDQAGIKHAGSGNNEDEAHAPVFVRSKGMRIAFLSYVNIATERGGFQTKSWTAGPGQPGAAWGEPKGVAQDVEAAKAQADYVIVLLHSGTENSAELNATQQSIGDAALDAGAVGVLGAHAHELQGWERRGEQFVAWGLGNFVFDFVNDSPGSTSTVLKLTLDEDGVSGVEWTPVEIVDGFPQTMDYSASDRAAAADAIDTLKINPGGAP